MNRLQLIWIGLGHGAIGRAAGVRLRLAERLVGIDIRGAPDAKGGEREACSFVAIAPLRSDAANRVCAVRRAARKWELPMKKYPLSKVYQLIEPGPVVLLTTARKGRPNVMTMSWLMPIEFTPPRVACVVSNGDFSFGALKTTRECVISIPSARLARKVVAIGNCSGRDVDKFALTGLTPLPARKVGAPLIRECFANLECRVIDTRLVAAYCLFILEFVEAWQNFAGRQPKMIHHRGNGLFVVDGRALKLPSKMP